MKMMMKEVVRPCVSEKSRVFEVCERLKTLEEGKALEVDVRGEKFVNWQSLVRKRLVGRVVHMRLDKTTMVVTVWL